MSLAPGRRLGPYEVVSSLGVGGMGEVYRARDARLGRDVALKILRPEHAGDPDRIRRFEREARAVAALEHPHILALHDVGSEDGLSYVVFELLEGETLRQRLLRGPVSARKCVEWGGQICRGLAAAHARGIVHRDLKPENIGLTSEGRIKILDFGLAKLTEASAPVGEATTLSATGPGGVVGTAGYVSPEQLREQQADARSDVFALGAVLYEMLSGGPAFGGDTRADRHSAVLHRDPPALASTAREPVPPALERIVTRCLEKDPEERFQSARDVAFALEAIGSASARETLVEPRRQPGRKAFRIATAALSLVGAAAVGFLAGRALVEYRPPAVRQLSTERGAITGARFAPDERTVVYSACWEGRPNDIILTRLDGPESRSLGLPPAKILSVSSRGELAILLTKPEEVGDPSLGTLARVALAGGLPRPLLEDVEDADWSPDGQTLAVVRRVGGERQLEYPLGNVLWRPIAAEEANTHGMRVSPRGDRVALVADKFLMIVDRSGARQALALPAAGATGIAWEPQGDAVWATSGETDHNKGVLRLGLDGSRRELYHGLGSPVLHDVSRSGAALLHQGYERGGVRVKLRGEATERELAGLSPASGAVDISPDGSQVIVGDQFKQGYYLYRVRGGDPVFLTDASAPARLSPDGQWLLVGPPRGQTRARLVPTGPGEPRDLEVGTLQNGSFSFLDSDHVYWRAYEAGASSRRAFVQDIRTGALRPVMPEGVEPYWSPVVEGALLGQRADGTLVWYPLDGGSPRPTAARLPGKEVSLNTTPDGRWTFVNSGGIPVRIERIDLRTGRRALWRSLAPPDLAGVVMMGWPWISMAPDGEAYAYNYLRVSQDLYLMEGLR